MNDKELHDWAIAISTRISDEWALKIDFKEDAILLQQILYKCFLASPQEMQNLIGTGVIEENHFEK